MAQQNNSAAIPGSLQPAVENVPVADAFLGDIVQQFLADNVPATVGEFPPGVCCDPDAHKEEFYFAMGQNKTKLGTFRDVHSAKQRFYEWLSVKADAFIVANDLDAVARKTANELRDIIATYRPRS
jgi:hypothetical protein